MSTQALLDKIAAERDERIADIEADAAETVAAIEAATAAEVTLTPRSSLLIERLSLRCN